MTPELILGSGALVAALAFGLRYIDRRIDARIHARLEADKNAADLKWWESHSDRAKHQLVAIYPRLLDDEVVAKWAAGQTS